MCSWGCPSGKIGQTDCSGSRVLFSAGVSGGHLNPALTVSLAVLGKVPWRKIPHYLLGQYLGAFLGASLVFLVYWDGLVWFESQEGLYRSIPETASIFSTFPSPHLSLLGGVGDQLLSTALLSLIVCSLSDNKKISQDSLLLPAVVGLTVLGLGTSLGLNCGFPLNPARDLAPRLVMGETSIHDQSVTHRTLQPCQDGGGRYSQASVTGGWSLSSPLTWGLSSDPSSTASSLERMSASPQRRQAFRGNLRTAISM